MDNNKEKSEHGFVKVSSNKNTETSNSKANKTKNSTFKVVVTSFISGIVGASLVLGLCFYVPAVRNIFVSSECGYIIPSSAVALSSTLHDVVPTAITLFPFLFVSLITSHASLEII